MRLAVVAGEKSCEIEMANQALMALMATNALLQFVKPLDHNRRSFARNPGMVSLHRFVSFWCMSQPKQFLRTEGREFLVVCPGH